MFLIASGTVKKVIEINKFLLGTVAGGAGMIAIVIGLFRFPDVHLFR